MASSDIYQEHNLLVCVLSCNLTCCTELLQKLVVHLLGHEVLSGRSLTLADPTNAIADGGRFCFFLVLQLRTGLYGGQIKINNRQPLPQAAG